VIRVGWLFKLRCFFARHRSQREFHNELEAHIALLTERYAARGMTREQALEAAHRQFGNVALLKETRNEMSAYIWFETLWQDLRYAVRSLAKNPAFAAVAILTLALGIGGNTAIYSVVNATILRPLPYPDPARLAVLWGNVKRVRVERRGASFPDFRDWNGQNHSFEGMAAFDGYTLALTGVDNPERISGESVSASYFPLLGIRAAVGRTFTPEEDSVPLRDAVLVLSDGMWKRRFGGDPSIAGRKIQLDGRAYTVVGVAPPGFRGLTDTAELWTPFHMVGSADDLNERGNRGFRVLARLKPGVSFARAQAEMDAISNWLAQAYPATNQARGVEVSPLDQEFFGDIHKPLWILLSTVGFVLLIGATNVANLLLARWETRQHEMAMRTALGAKRWRLIRQLLAESLVLVGFGCAAGFALAHFGIRALLAASPLKLPSFVDASIDFNVALFAALVCCVVTVALGLAPALQLEFGGPGDGLKQSGGRTTGGRRGSRFRNALVVAEVSLSLVLLIGAGLMLRSLRRISGIDPGYVANHVVNVRVSLPRLQPTAAANAAVKPDAAAAVAAKDILHNVSTVPSVESASIATDAPLSGDNAIFYAAEGQPPMTAQVMPRAYFHRVSSDFFRTLRTRFLAGRTFSEQEIHDNANVAIVTENMVRRFWSGQDPIGKRIKVGGLDSPRPWLTIIGVIGELKYRGLPQNPTADPDLFQVFNERSREFSVLARTSLEPDAMITAVRAALRQTDPSILIYNAGSLDELVGRETARPRVTGWLMAIFAGIALVLAVIGIYGVISYSVSQRRREIGVRMALGAGRPEVLLWVAKHGLAPVILGMLIGTAGALALTRILASLVYDVSPSDPLTFGAAAGLLLAAAIAACLLPALRASRIDPAVALRN
jgi:predicted permease